MATILIPCKIPKFVNLDVLKLFVSKDILGNKEYFDEQKITYTISNPKKAEWLMHKSIKGSKLIGNGNKNLDIELDKIGIDVSVLTLNRNISNEKSLIQNFTTGNELDMLFLNNDCEEAVDIFKDKLKKKYQCISKEIYYLIFICQKNNIYLTSLKLCCENIDDMMFSTRTRQNIIINNFIDNKFGQVKLYKSKKRLELRLHKDILHHESSVRLF